MNKLEKLFDYQKFEKNEHLDKVISDSLSQQSMELSDDLLSEVTAAGVMARRSTMLGDDDINKR